MPTKDSSPIISRPNAPIYFKKEGRGKAHFALFHNAGANHLFMRKVFAHLKRRGVALTFDWPGHGKSKPRADGDYSLEAQGEMIAELLQNQGGKKWVVVGLNFGANLDNRPRYLHRYIQGLFELGQERP
jgi:pimeloyl-ACP methyl ester carboxylesterase